MSETILLKGNEVMSEITDVMSTDVITINPKTTIAEAVEILLKHSITGVPVVDTKKKLLGIVSEKDLLKLIYEFKSKSYDSNNRLETVESIMTKDVVSFDENDLLIDVCKCLMEGNFRRVPILSGGKVVGIISRPDLLACKP